MVEPIEFEPVTLAHGNEKNEKIVELIKFEP